MDKLKRIGNSLKANEELAQLETFLKNVILDVNRLSENLDAINFKVDGVKNEIEGLKIKHLNPIRRFLRRLSDDTVKKRAELSLRRKGAKRSAKIHTRK